MKWNEFSTLPGLDKDIAARLIAAFMARPNESWEGVCDFFRFKWEPLRGRVTWPTVLAACLLLYPPARSQWLECLHVLKGCRILPPEPTVASPENELERGIQITELLNYVRIQVIPPALHPGRFHPHPECAPEIGPKLILRFFGTTDFFPHSGTKRDVATVKMRSLRSCKVQPYPN